MVSGTLKKKNEGIIKVNCQIIISRIYLITCPRKWKNPEPLLNVSILVYSLRMPGENTCCNAV